MSILAGVVRRDAHAVIDDALCEALRRGISRNAADERIEFRDEGAYFVKVDVGAYDRPAHRRAASGSFSMLAGEPLPLGEGIDDERRDVQLRLLHDRLDEARLDVLRCASGTFCAAYYDPRRQTAYLIADRLGLRPLYYAIDGELVYFASAMRILESLPALQKTMDVVSVVEMTGFGYPFGGGTPYAGITMLQACEIVANRTANGPFFRPEELVRRGLATERTVKRLAPRLICIPPGPHPMAWPPRWGDGRPISGSRPTAVAGGLRTRPVQSGHSGRRAARGHRTARPGPPGRGRAPAPPRRRRSAARPRSS